MGRWCLRILGVVLLAGVVVVGGCKQKQATPQPEETAAVSEEAAAVAEKVAAEKVVPPVAPENK